MQDPGLLVRVLLPSRDILSPRILGSRIGTMRDTKQQFIERVARDNSVDYTGMEIPDGFGGTATVLRNLGPQPEMKGWHLYEVEKGGLVYRWTSAVLHAAVSR